MFSFILENENFNSSLHHFSNSSGFLSNALTKASAYKTATLA